MQDLLAQAAADSQGEDPVELCAVLEAQRNLVRNFVHGQRQRIQDVLAQLVECREQLAAAPADNQAASDEGLRQQFDDLQRRYEMALDDLKRERSRCEELEGQVAHGAPSASAALSMSALDWEAQKQQLLASLESDFDADEEDENRRRQRLTVEEAIARTDEVIAAKQRDIDSLQRMLEEQGANLDSMAVGAAAVAEVLDKDMIIQQERQNLQQLQQEWQDKLRQAEVEISVQRAKLARGQMELEEKTRQLEQQLRNAELPEDAQDKQESTRGNWLRRLGLKGGDDE